MSDERQLIGRAKELEQISAFLQDVARGPSALLISGEVGIGKTTVWRWAVSSAQLSGFRVLRCRPAASETGWAFSGLADLLRDVIDEVRPELAPPQRAAVDAAFLLEEAAEAPNPLAVSLACRRSLGILAASGPVLVAVDDAQWLDEPSAAAITGAIRRLERESVGLLLAGSVRGVASGAAGYGVEGMLASDRVRTISLSALSATELADLVQTRLESTSLRPLVPELHRVSRGNPLYALEIARAVVEGRIRVEPGRHLRVPIDLTNLVRGHLDALSPATRKALLVLASCSDPTTELIGRALGRSVKLNDVVDEAVSAGVIEVNENSRLRFTNPILGAALYDSAAPEVTRAVHRWLGDVVDDPEERARHLARSVVGADEHVAATLDEAAGGARRRGAPSAAAELSEMACGLTSPDDVAASVGRRIRAAEYHLDAGNLARSAVLLEEAVALAEPGPVRAAALQRLGWVMYHSDGWRAAAPMIEQALEEAGDDDRLRTAIELDHALARLVSGDLAAAASAAQDALEQGRRFNDPVLQRRAAAMLGSVQFLLGKGVPADVMANTIADETWTRPAPTMEHPSVAFGVVLKLADDLEGARERLTSAHRRLLEVGNERSLPFLLFHLAELECWSGNLAEAEGYATEATRVAIRTGQEASRAFTLYAEALVDALRGREQSARDKAEEGIGIAEGFGAIPAIPLLISVLGFLDLSVDDVAAAYRRLRPLAEDALVVGVHEPGAVRYLGDAIEALIGVGEIEQARRLLEELEERASLLDRRWALAIAGRCRGLLLEANGDLDSATASLEMALAIHGELSQPFEAARTEMILGRVHRRARRKRAGRGALERALETFETLGIPLWAERAQREIDRVGGKPVGTTELTPTEERVAELVSTGATNDEVARTLFVTPKTVEWNLTRIYRKLGVRSRTELARWLTTDSRGRS
jgi:DNA-binding CsgD family transcriptional regulator